MKGHFEKGLKSENQPENMNDSFQKNRALVHIMSLNCHWILELANATRRQG